LACGIFGLVGIVAGALAVSAEQSHLLASGTSPEERIELFVSGARQPGLSSRTQRQFMIDCRNSIIHAARLALPDDQRRALATACLDAARTVVEEAPASSFGWFSIAHSSLALGDRETLNRALSLSQATGSNEGWIARYRVELVEGNRSLIDPDYLPRHRADLATLVDNIWVYDDFLAGIYIRRPESRADMTDVIEQRENVIQRRFLYTVDRARRDISNAPS